MKIPQLLKLLILTAVAVAVFYLPDLFGMPLPRSLLVLYLFFSILMILLVLTVTDEGVEGIKRPLLAFLKEPSWRRPRLVVFIILPLFLSALTYRMVSTSVEPPFEHRQIHPSPPDSFRAYGKRFVVQKTVNPFRALEKTDPEAFRALVRQGGIIYFRRCFFCHGAKLDGRGHVARALSPRPLPFTGRDTIAQLQESYLFWRIVKGGPGLPPVSAPWSSAMPAWEKILTEDEVWKVILFLYDFTGNRPQTWTGSR